MYPYPDYQLLVFAKSPRLGKAKTRMQPQLPPEFSLALHTQLVDYALSQWTGAALCPLELWLAGERSDFQQALPQWQGLALHLQEGQDLGARMQFAAEQSLKKAEGVILLGTDCPFIDSAYLAQACQALKNNDVVIGPATDGGYVLLGLKKSHAALFENIEWGTASVYAETMKQVKKQALHYHILPTLNDIDRPDDLPALNAIEQFKSFLSHYLAGEQG